MKLLFDQNLSHRRPSRLTDLFPDSEHVRKAGLDRASDDQVCNYARQGGFCIFTQDADFPERSRLRGSPPKVIWLRCGNTTARETERIMRDGLGLIQQLLSTPESHCLELFR